MTEVWKGFKYKGNDYSNRFEISNTGRLRNKETGTEYKFQTSGGGFKYTSLSFGHNNLLYIRLPDAVAENFIDGFEFGDKVLFNDGNCKNCCADNLGYEKKEIENVPDTTLSVNKGDTVTYISHIGRYPTRRMAKATYVCQRFVAFGEDICTYDDILQVNGTSVVDC